MPDEPKGYDLEPDAPKPPPAPAPQPTPKLERPRLIEGFDPGTDFDRDPEVQAAMKTGGKPSVDGRKPIIGGKPLPEPAAPAGATPLSGPWLGPAQVWAVVGAVLLIGAIVAAGINEAKPFPAGLLVVYWGLVNTMLGVVSLSFAGWLCSRPVGDFPLAAARMLTAVGAFLVLFNLNIRLLGETKWEELILAVLAFSGIVAALFKVWGRTLAYIVCCHFILWIVLQVGMELAVWMRQKGS